MKIPERVEIGGHVFRISIVEVVNKHTPRRAEIDHLAGEIRIDAAMAHSRQEQSLLHEILHEVDQQFATGLDEATLARLAEGLYAVLKLNHLHFGFGD
ncbi:MAG: hypothetical protein ACOY9Y_09680 [Bacillota bacterium]